MKLKKTAIRLTTALTCAALAIVLAAILLSGYTLNADPNAGAGTNAPPLVGTPGDEVVDNACYLYTPQIVEDTFRYLDEIYSEKYPALGLRWEHGTGADQRIMTALARKITEDCSTDVEKQLPSLTGSLITSPIGR